MAYSNQKAAEANGWQFYFVADTVGELRVERPAAWKLLDGNRKEAVSDSVPGVLRAIEETEANYSQHVANVKHQKKQAEAEGK